LWHNILYTINELINKQKQEVKMKKLLSILAVATLLVAYSDLSAQTQNPPVNHGKNFVDNNGDGYNDNAPDHDGDGIPNGVDPDYTGPKLQKGKFVDLNGDGINDNAGKKGGKSGKGGYGPQDGTGNKGVGPKDGTGNGTGAGTANCDGTGPKGNRGNKGGRK